MTKPTKPQLEVLERAMSDGCNHDKPVGRLLDYGVSVTTTDIMKANGWIERKYAVVGMTERQRISDELFRHITDARIRLSSLVFPIQYHEWAPALKSLKAAERLENELNAMAYWITDAGRAILEQTKGGAK